MQKPKLIWLNVLVFALTGLITLFGVPVYAYSHGFDGWQIAAMMAGVVFCEISITAGYHRLWAHRAYEAHWLVRLIFAIGGTFAAQNSILHWSSDHRVHHRHVDDNHKDPYSAKRGFWYAHIGWMLRDHGVHSDPQYTNCKDLQKDPIVMWQDRHYVALTTFMNLGLPLLLGFWLGDVIGTVLLVGLLRLVVNHHVTFFINSLAHYWGTRPYTESNSARDNGFLAFLTYGEGYHNYHHIFQADYRNGIRWWQWDPTKWMIALCSHLGLASNLNRVSGFKIQRAILDTQFRRARHSLDETASSETLRATLEREYQLFTESINQWTALQAERYERKKAELGDVLEDRRQRLQQKWESAFLRTKLRELEYSLKMQRKRLVLLMEQVQLQAQAA